jgi:hypothetical protein
MEGSACRFQASRRHDRAGTMRGSMMVEERSDVQFAFLGAGIRVSRRASYMKNVDVKMNFVRVHATKQEHTAGGSTPYSTAAFLRRC